MKAISLKMLTVLLIIFALSISGCAGTDEKGSGANAGEGAPQAGAAAEEAAEEAADVRAAFEEFLDWKFKGYVTGDTISLHYTLRYPENFGIERIEPTLGEFGTDVFAEYEKQSIEALETLKSFPYGDLSGEQQLVYDTYKYYLELDIGLFKDDLQYYMTLLKPVSGAQSNLPVLLAEYQFFDENDIKDYLALLRDVDRFFQSALKFEQEKSEKGLFMSDFAADAVIGSCKDFIASKENNFLIEIFEEKISGLGLSEEKKAEYIEENKKRVIFDMIPAYENLVRGLTELKGTGKNDSGLCHFPRGKEYYEYLIRTDIGTSESIESLAAMIEERLDMVTYGTSYIIEKNEAVLDKLLNPDFGSNDPEELIGKLKAGMAGYYPENAGTSHKVKTLHSSLEGSFSAAFYLSVPIDDYSSAVIYINKGSMADGDLFPVLAHEGYPGHLYQDTYFKSTGPHPMRDALSSIGYIEGWATYAEINAYFFADFPDSGPELALLMGYETEYSLAIQSRCDIGVNYEGWSYDDLKKFMSGIGIESERSSRSVYEYVIKDPSRTLRYYVGYMELENLYNYAYDQMGGDFSLYDFHECVLDVGPVPFFLVKEAIDGYIVSAGGSGRSKAPSP